MKTYYFIVKNNDTKQFNVFGPVADDTAYTNTVADLQRSCEPISCFTVEADSIQSRVGVQAINDVISKTTVDIGYTFSSRLYKDKF